MGTKRGPYRKLAAGQRFGTRVVVGPDRLRGRCAWECICDCGRRDVVLTAHLVRAQKCRDCARNARMRQVCGRGHPMTDPANLKVWGQRRRRQCRACTRENARRWAAANRLKLAERRRVRPRARVSRAIEDMARMVRKERNRQIVDAIRSGELYSSIQKRFRVSEDVIGWLRKQAGIPPLTRIERGRRNRGIPRPRPSRAK